jgi:arylsulfatase A-like enzyme
MTPPFRTILAVAALALGCTTQAPDQPGPAGANVVLVSIDTLRPDHLGCYGYERPTSPSIDTFRRDAVLYTEAIAHAPSTLHSHASMLTSLLPQHHRASWGAKTRLPLEALSVAEVLQQAGYRTVAFTGGGQMDRIFGLDQGFDDYVQPETQTFAETVEHSLEWLAAAGGEPFFMFLHSYEPHHPYDPEPEDLAVFEQDYAGELPDEIGVELLRSINQGDVEIDEADLAHIVATYDAEILSVDRGFARLAEGLKALDLYDDTLIVFTSDHGEEFGEHGRVGWHSHSLYDELLRVPLLVKYPGAQHGGSTAAEQVRLIDIPPTILAAASVAAPPEFIGVDLVARLNGEGSAEELPAVSRLDRRHDREVASLRTSKWKLYPPWLFDLEQDAAEEWDATTSHPSVARELEQLLGESISARPPLDAPQVAPTQKNLDELKALGYL